MKGFPLSRYVMMLGLVFIAGTGGFLLARQMNGPGEGVAQGVGKGREAQAVIKVSMDLVAQDMEPKIFADIFSRLNAGVREICLGTTVMKGMLADLSEERANVLQLPGGGHQLTAQEQKERDELMASMQGRVKLSVLDQGVGVVTYSLTYRDEDAKVAARVVNRLAERTVVRLREGLDTELLVTRQKLQGDLKRSVGMAAQSEEDQLRFRQEYAGFDPSDSPEKWQLLFHDSMKRKAELEGKLDAVMESAERKAIQSAMVEEQVKLDHFEAINSHFFDLRGKLQKINDAVRVAQEAVDGYKAEWEKINRVLGADAFHMSMVSYAAGAKP